MATSSIFATAKISELNQVEIFTNALEKSEKEKIFVADSKKIKVVSDSLELKQLFQKGFKKNR